ncbi:MAG: PH domain-containing protein [Patescibacteria group bacterium]
MEEFDLQPGEHVIRAVRQHPFVLALKLVPLLLLAYVPSLITFALSYFASASPQAATAIANLPVGSAIGTFLTGVWWLFLWLAAFSTFTRYYLTVWIITNVRIVDIKQYGFFNREVSSFLLLRVQDVSTEIYGFLATLVGFGRLNVETAGSVEKFTMTGIVHPQVIRDVIMDQVAALHPAETDKSGV